MALCAIDDKKIPMMDTHRKLKDGGSICAKHFKEAGLRATDNSKDYTRADILNLITGAQKIAQHLGNATNELSKSERKAYSYLVSRRLTNLDPDTFQDVSDVATDLAGNGLIKAGLALSFSNAAEQAEVSYLSALVNQNWILVKQNTEIINNLKELNKKIQPL